MEAGASICRFHVLMAEALLRSGEIEEKHENIWVTCRSRPSEPWCCQKGYCGQTGNIQLL